MLSCKDVASRASALIDGELSAWEALQMRVHLAMCKGCQRFVGQLRITRDLIAAAGGPDRQTPDTDTLDAEALRITAILSQRTGGPQDSQKGG